MIDEGIDLDEAVSDIDVLVKSMTNAGESWECNIDSSDWNLSNFTSSPSLSQYYLYHMNDLCKAGNGVADESIVCSVTLACPIQFCSQFNVDSSTYNLQW